MARQSGVLRHKGTMGGITFYKTSADGYLAREKGGVDKNRIKNDPAFQRTRENGSEFGRAGKNGKLLRNAVRVLLQNAKDNRVTGRLTKDVLAVIKTDATNVRGERVITEGDMQLLNGFEFNVNGKLGSSLFVPITTAVDRVSGEVTTDLAEFIANVRINAPTGTTHYRINSGAAEVDFENESFVFDMEQTAIEPFDEASVSAQTLTSTLTANSTLPIVGVVGVEFYQEVNGQMYPLKNGAFNALAITVIDNS